MSNFSASERISWPESGETTEKEDRVYDKEPGAVLTDASLILHILLMYQASDDRWPIAYKGTAHKSDGQCSADMPNLP